MKNLITNLILNTDSYKLSHYLQYPPGTTNVFSYIESRGTNLNWIDPKIMMLGLQPFIRDVLSKPITKEDVLQAKKVVEAHGLPFNEDGWNYIVDVYGGLLPIRIRAVKEGTMLPLHNIMVSVEATDPSCAWVTSYIETALLRAVWYPSSVASNSFRAKQIIKHYLDKTSDMPDEELPFKLHDFGARGVSSCESAELGGMAHLVNFMGTDTLSGVLAAMEYYDAEVCGFSIPASEHSTMTAWTKDGEEDAAINMLKQFGGKGKIVAVVSDSYDIYNMVDNVWGKELKEMVHATGGTLVVRPDSGDPITMPIEVIEMLMKKENYGYTLNHKGYKVLPGCIRVIQGDGIDIDDVELILKTMEEKKISASNIAFGMGGGLLQKVDRDTYKFAMKASAIEIDNQWRDVFKDPVTDPGKKSKKGLLTLVQDRETGEFRTIKMTDPIKETEVNVMHTVYHNGPCPANYMTFDQVRAESEKYL